MSRVHASVLGPTQEAQVRREDRRGAGGAEGTEGADTGQLREFGGRRDPTDLRLEVVFMLQYFYTSLAVFCFILHWKITLEEKSSMV